MPPTLDLDDLIAAWPRPARSALAVSNATDTLGTTGDLDRVSRIASISKVSAGLSALVAYEEGTIDLDEPAGPPGATVRHLLAHAAGYGFDGAEPIAAVGKRRIYSNTGIEVFAEHLAAAAGMPFADYQRAAVFEPLGMTHTELKSSPAFGVHSNVADLLLLARELLAPTLVAPETLAEATTPQFPELAGVLPRFGRHDPNPWGLGMEIRGTKQPHWTAPSNSARTFGHFGGSGTYLWVDPDLGIAAAGISGVDFGAWAVEAWPATNQAIVERIAPSDG